MSRDVAALGEATREMICDRTQWKYSIKAGALFLSAHAPAFAPPKKAIMNERRMMMSANFLKSQREKIRVFALALCENEKQCIVF